MDIRASIYNDASGLHGQVETAGRPKDIALPPKPDGVGSLVNGGELLFLALATCYCNDLYREAAALNLRIDGVEVSVSGQFGGRGEPARNVLYDVRIHSPEPEPVLQSLIAQTDSVAEIHNTLRQGCAVRIRSTVVLTARPDLIGGDQDEVSRVP